MNVFSLYASIGINDKPFVDGIARVAGSATPAIDSFNKLENAQGKLSSGLKMLGDTAGKVMGTIAKVSAAAATAVTAFAGKYIKDAMTAANDYAIAQQKLATVMRNNIGASDEQIASIERLAAAQERAGVVSKASQVTALAELASFVNRKQSLEDMLPVMNDYIAYQFGINASEESARNVATALGKAIQGNIDGLAKQGFSFSEAQKEIMKYGNEAQRVQVVMDMVSESMSGVNEGIAQTDAGKMFQLSVAMSEVQLKIGQLANAFKNRIAGEMLPSVSALLDAFTRLLSGMGSPQELAVAFGSAVDSIMGILDGILPVALEVGANMIVSIATGITKAIPKLIKKAGEIAPKVVKTIGQGLQEAFPILRPIISAIDFLVEHFGTIAKVLLPVVAAFVAFKAVMTAATFATTAYTAITKTLAAFQKIHAVATGAATVAQTGLNAAMMANPIGLVIGALALLVVGIGAFVNAIKGAKDSTQQLSEKFRAINEEMAKTRDIQEHIRRYKELKNEIENSTLSTEALAEKTEELNAVRQWLIDNSDGMIKASSDVRGEFDKELEQVENLIESYSGLQLLRLESALLDARAAGPDILAKEVSLLDEKKTLENDLIKLIAERNALEKNRQAFETADTLLWAERDRQALIEQVALQKANDLMGEQYRSLQDLETAGNDYAAIFHNMDLDWNERHSNWEKSTALLDIYNEAIKDLSDSEKKQAELETEMRQLLYASGDAAGETVFSYEALVSAIQDYDVKITRLTASESDNTEEIKANKEALDNLLATVAEGVMQGLISATDAFNLFGITVDETTGAFTRSTDAIKSNSAAWAQLKGKMDGVKAALTSFHSMQLQQIQTILTESGALEALTGAIGETIKRYEESDRIQAGIVERRRIEAEMERRRIQDAANLEKKTVDEYIALQKKKADEDAKAAAEEQKAFEQRQNAIAKYADIATAAFEKISTRSRITAKTMAATLKHNREATEAWVQNLATIEQNFGPEFGTQFSQMIANLGVKEGAGVAANLAKAKPTEIATLISEWEKYGEQGVAAFIKGLEISEGEPGLMDQMTADLEAGKESFVSAVEAIGKEAAEVLTSPLTAEDTGIAATIETMVTSMIETIEAKSDELAKAGKAIADKVRAGIESAIAAFRQFPIKMVSVGAQMVEGVWAGFNSKAAGVKAKITAWFNSLVQSVTVSLSISSPSRVFADIGKNMGLGVLVGWDTVSNDIEKTITDSLTPDARALNPKFDIGSSYKGAGAEYGGTTINNYIQTVATSPQEIAAMIEMYLSRRKWVAAV